MSERSVDFYKNEVDSEAETPENFPNITILGLAEAYAVFESSEADFGLVSIQSPDDRVPTFVDDDNPRHLFLSFHDVDRLGPMWVAPSGQHVRAIIKSAQNILKADEIICHCFAGVSRSSATALILASIAGADEEAAVKEVIRRRKIARPNRRMLRIADQALGTQLHSAAVSLVEYTKPE